MKTALVTGGSRGIGAACARMLVRDGYRVIVNYNSSRRAAETLAKELDGTAVKADVSDRKQVEEMFRSVGSIDVLVNNAGIAATQQLLTDMPYNEWRRIFSVNVDGIFNCCKMAIPDMVRKKSGKIINISSIWGITGGSCEVAYSASKAAVIGFTKALAKELGPSGIQVNCVAPGVVNTEMNSGLTYDDMKALTEETPLGKIGDPKDVAAVVAFLASPGGNFLTGQVISPNGGIVI